MSRYIDADNAIERLGAYLMTDAQIEYGGLASEDIEDWKPIAIDILKGAPSIDIVFCKECKWRKGEKANYCGRAKDFMMFMPQDGFCSYGERDELSVCDLCGIKNKGIPCGTEPRVCSKAISRAEQIEPRPETHDLRINTHACVEDKLQTIAEDINRRVKNAYRSCDMAEDEPQMEMSGVLTLTEESSNELFRVLEEQDKAYINDVLDGKCGFTIKSTDGRSVELVPTQNKRNQRIQSVEACDMCCIQTEVGCEQTDCPWR